MNETPKVYQAIVNVTQALSKDGIAKSRKNTSQNYAFRGIDDIYNALASELAKNKLCVLPVVLERGCVERISAKGGALFYVTVEVAFDFVSAEDGSKHQIITHGEAMDSGDKATNKAMSAAYKYAALMAFCIPTEGDNDSENQTHEVRSTIEDDAITIATAIDNAKTMEALDDIVHTNAQFTGDLKDKLPKWHAALIAKIDTKRHALAQGRTA